VIRDRRGQIDPATAPPFSVGRLRGRTAASKHCSHGCHRGPAVLRHLDLACQLACICCPMRKPIRPSLPDFFLGWWGRGRRRPPAPAVTARATGRTSAGAVKVSGRRLSPAGFFFFFFFGRAELVKLGLRRTPWARRAGCAPPDDGLVVFYRRQIHFFAARRPIRGDRYRPLETRRISITGIRACGRALFSPRPACACRSVASK